MVMVSPSHENPPPAAPVEGKTSDMVEHFFRHETGRLHATLTRMLGTQHLTLIEDVAQEALLRAMKTWAIGGFPANPSAWITRVAINLARDALRHKRMSATKEPNVITHMELTMPEAPATGDSELQIRDDTLRLMFVCCHPAIAPDAQVVLALKVMCGFSTGEIARAFMSSEAAIEKQLTRTKQRIQKENIGYSIPEGAELASRLDGVLAALYLLFNEGYKASSGERLLREDLCHEAIRLASQLVAHPAGATSRSHALLAFMLLTSARFPARLDAQGELLRLDGQDRSKWDQNLIQRGLMHLMASAEGNELSEYHLQAGIAACHGTARDYASTDWARILAYYDELLRLKPSPMVALNRAVAVAQLHGPKAGLEAIEAIPQKAKLESHYLLHAVLGEFCWRLGDYPAAAASFRRALQFAAVGPEQQHIQSMLDRSAPTESLPAARQAKPRRHPR